MQLPRERFGPYRLLRWLGSGASGAVFAAIHEHMDREVALKVLSPDAAGDPQRTARFVQEARALAQLDHPGIVRVHDCERLEDGAVYVAMEYLAGTTLRAWMREHRGGVAFDAALEVGRQIADAMVEVHAKGIIHRDLKPENVILVADAANPIGHRAKVVDFGIAKVPPAASAAPVDTQVQTAMPALLGTATYMAPEQCKNAAEVTDRADVYALGVLLFELLAGKPPFSAKEPIEVITMHVQLDPPAVQEVVPAVPYGLGRLVTSMLAKDPAQRPTMTRCREILARPWKLERRASPFPGLMPFTEDEAELFFGREEETSEIVSALEGMVSGRTRWLQIEGPSGAGKSSLVQAGVLPRLRASGAASWTIATLRLSGDPTRSLARALRPAMAEALAGGAPADLEDALRDDDGALTALLERWGAASFRLLLVIEQLEELFAPGSSSLDHFDALLSAALSAKETPLRLLSTMRSDHIHRLDQTPRLAGLLNAQACRYYLRPMSEAAIARVVQDLAACAGLRLSDGLPARMVRDATGTDSRLPLLGHALQSLWAARSGAQVTHAHYESVGGVAGALSRHAEMLVAGLGEEGRERAKWLILDLVQVGRGVPDTRRSRTREEVLKAAGGDRMAEQVLMRLSGEAFGARAEKEGSLRLVLLSGEGGIGSQQRVDLVHETLLVQVPTIAGWIEGERALLERRTDLEVAAQIWERAGCPDVGLPGGSLLDHYRGQAGDGSLHPQILRMVSPRALRFIASAERRERRRVRLLQAAAGAVIAVIALIATSAVVALRESRRAETNLQHTILATMQVVSEADWELGRLLYTRDVRQRMLEHIDNNLSSLPAREQETPAVVMAIVKTKHRRSDFARANETLAHATEFIDAASERIFSGLARDPRASDLRMLLALNDSKRGKIALARRRYKDAWDDFGASIGTLLEMGANSPDDRRTLATSYTEAGDVALAIERPSIAVSLYGQAVDLLRRNDGELYDQSLLAMTLGKRADAERRIADFRAAFADLGEALRLFEAPVDAAPGNTLYREMLGETYVALAALHQDGGRVADAARFAEAAIEIGEALVRADPTHKDYALLLCHGLQAAEDLADATGDRDRAARARARRCQVARDHGARDAEDLRFHGMDCP